MSSLLSCLPRRLLVRSCLFRSGKPIFRLNSNYARVYQHVYPDDAVNKIAADTVIYELPSYSFYTSLLLSCGTLTLIVLYGGVYLVHLANSGVYGRGYSESAILANRVMGFVRDYSTLMGVFCMASGGFCFGAAKLRVMRTIRRIVLRPGDRVIIEHFHGLPLSKNFKSIECPLGNVSCKNGRLDDGNVVDLKLKGHAFLFKVDKKGYFPDPYLFDHTVGVQRKV